MSIPRYSIPQKLLQSKMAKKSNISYIGASKEVKLYDKMGLPIIHNAPKYRKNCDTCGNKMICSGCGNCDKCK